MALFCAVYAPLAAPAPAPAMALAPSLAAAPTLAPAPGPLAEPPPPATNTNVSVRLNGITSAQFAGKEQQYNDIIAKAAGVPSSWVNSTVVPGTGSTGAAGRRLRQTDNGGVTVGTLLQDEHIFSHVWSVVAEGQCGCASVKHAAALLLLKPFPDIPHVRKQAFFLHALCDT